MGPNGLQNVKSFTSFIMDKGAVIVHGAGTRHKENFNKWLLRKQGQLTLKKKERKKERKREISLRCNSTS